MDQMILGLLLLRSRTIYQLRERIAKGLDLMYSSSMGSIQAAIKKLLRGGYIAYEEVVGHGKHKKVYRITQRGRQHFYEWINAPIVAQGIRCPELVKVYFMGFADRENREASIQNYLSFLKEQHAVLEAICEEAEHVELPAHSREIFEYQLISARYGKDLYQFNIDWFETMYKKMREGEL